MKSVLLAGVLLIAGSAAVNAFPVNGQPGTQLQGRQDHVVRQVAAERSTACKNLDKGLAAVNADIAKLEAAQKRAPLSKGAKDVLDLRLSQRDDIIAELARPENKCQA